MSEEKDSVWEEIHYGEAPIVDVHAHPSLKVFLFRRALTRRLRAYRAYNPLRLRTDFKKLVLRRFVG